MGESNSFSIKSHCRDRNINCINFNEEYKKKEFSLIIEKAPKNFLDPFKNSKIFVRELNEFIHIEGRVGIQHQLY